MNLNMNEQFADIRPVTRALKQISKAKLGETGEGMGSALGQLGHELKQGYDRVWDAIKDA